MNGYPLIMSLMTGWLLNIVLTQLGPIDDTDVSTVQKQTAYQRPPDTTAKNGIQGLYRRADPQRRHRQWPRLLQAAD